MKINTLFPAISLVLLILPMLTTSMERRPEDPESERPGKRIRSSDEPEEVFNPLMLKEQAARVIARKLPTLYQNGRTVMELPGDCRDAITSEVLEIIKRELPVKQVRTSTIKSPRLDSECYFLKNNRHFVCMRPTDRQCSIIDSEYIRAAETKASFKFIPRPQLCFRKPNEQDSRRCSGILYCMNNDTMQEMKFFPDNETDDEQMKYTRISKAIVPPLPGSLDLITPYFDSVLVKVTDTTDNDYQKLFFISKGNGRAPRFIKAYTNKPTITHLKQGIGNGLFVLFETGTGEFLDAETLTHKNFRIATTETVTPAISVDLNPNRKKLACGFSNGKLTIYNTETNTLETIIDNDPRPFSALKFLGDNRIIVARNNIARPVTPIPDVDEENSQEAPEESRQDQEDPDEILLQIWDLDLKKLVAHAEQYEPRFCNTLDVNASRDTLILGMGLYDVGLQKMSSFEPDWQCLDSNKLYADPSPLFKLVDDGAASLQKKLDFITQHSSRSDE